MYGRYLIVIYRGEQVPMQGRLELKVGLRRLLLATPQPEYLVDLRMIR